MGAVNAYYNLEAERAILAAGMKRGGSWKKLQVLIPDDFYEPAHQRIFRAEQALLSAGKPADMATMPAALAKYGEADADMLVLIEIMRNSFGSEFGIDENVRIVKDLHLRRTLHLELENAMDALGDAANDTETILERTRQRMRDMVTTGHEWQNLNSVMLNTFEALERRAKGDEKGIPYGIYMLDKHMAGLHRGELTVIGARPAVGKSALGAYIALSAAESGYKVGICSREMTDIQYGVRLLANRTQVDPMRMRTGEISDADWDDLTEAMMHFGTQQIDFLFTTRNVEDLRMEVQKRVDSEGMDVLVVDYMQLLQTRERFEKDYLRVGYVSKTLKDMTVDFNIAVVALAQVGRSSDGDMPTLAELRGSGDIEQDADNVIFMHRPKPGDKCVDPADRDMIHGLEMQKLRYIALDIAKQRQGETMTTSVIFDPARMRFTGIAREAE